MVKVAAIDRGLNSATIRLVLLNAEENQINVIKIPYRVVGKRLLTRSPARTSGTISLGPTGTMFSEDGQTLESLPRYAFCSIGPPLILAKLK